MTIDDAVTPEQVEAVRALTAEYAALPHVEGRWLHPDREVAALPEPYVPPGGGMLLATHDGRPVGSVVWLRTDDEAVELRRLYVRPEARRLGVGRALSVAVLERATGVGARMVRLDTLPELTDAVALYLSLGFVEIPPWRELYPGARCFEWRAPG